MADRKQIDWEKIKIQYELDQLSTREISKQFNISHTIINRKAKKEGWIKDKSAEIRRKTKAALVSSSNVSESVSTATKEDVDRAIQTNITLVRGHQKRLGKAHEIAEILMSQLNDAITKRDEIVETVKEEETTNYQKRAAMIKAVQLPSQSNVLYNLSSALKILIPLERQAFNIDDNSGDDKDPVKIEIKFIDANPSPTAS